MLRSYFDFSPAKDTFPVKSKSAFWSAIRKFPFKCLWLPDTFATILLKRRPFNSINGIFPSMSMSSNLFEILAATVAFNDTLLIIFSLSISRPTSNPLVRSSPLKVFCLPMAFKCPSTFKSPRPVFSKPFRFKAAVLPDKLPRQDTSARARDTRSSAADFFGRSDTMSLICAEVRYNFASAKEKSKFLGL